MLKPKAEVPRSKDIEITLSSPAVAALQHPLQPRALGDISLSVKPVDGGTGLDQLRQSGSLKALFPRSSGPLQAVLVNTAGGVTGGDRFALSARAKAGTKLTLTTQAAERAYCAQPGETGQIRNRLFGGEGSHLNWVPQETILFNGSSTERTLQIELADAATLLMVEPLVFGRTAMGERLTQVHFRDRVEIRRNGRIFYLDVIALSGNVTEHLSRPTVAADAQAMATLLWINPNAEAQLEPLRAILPESAGASLIQDDLLALRMLAPDSYALRCALIPILNRLTRDKLPKAWMT